MLSLLPCRRIEGVSDDERQQKVDAQQDCTCCGAMVELLLAECAEKSSEKNVIQAYVQTYVQLAEKIDLRCMHRMMMICSKFPTLVPHKTSMVSWRAYCRSTVHAVKASS